MATKGFLIWMSRPVPKEGVDGIGKWKPKRFVHPAACEDADGVANLKQCVDRSNGSVIDEEEHALFLVETNHLERVYDQELRGVPGSKINDVVT